jgi:hypothetical protein
MDFNFFENDVIYQIFNMNLNQIVWRIFFLNLNIFSKIFSKIFLEYFPQNNHKNNKNTSRCGSCYPLCTPKHLFEWIFQKHVCIEMSILLEVVNEHGYNELVLWVEYVKCGRYDILNIYLLSKNIHYISHIFHLTNYNFWINLMVKKGIQMFRNS